MNQENKIYQLNILFSSLTKEEKIQKIIQTLKQKITSSDGSVSEEIPSPGIGLTKKRISYPIRKEQEGFYSILKFTSPTNTDLIKEIKKYLQSEKRILRQLITVKKITKLKPVKENLDMKLIDKIEPIKKEKTESTPEPVKKKKSSIKKEKVKIEELDKKLSEILSE